VTEQSRLDVFDPQRFAEEWVVKQIDLTDGQIVGCAPVGVHALNQVLR
jgi:hypothetical protein